MRRLEHAILNKKSEKPQQQSDHDEISEIACVKD